MYAASFLERVVKIPRSLCLVVGGVMTGALYLGGVMTVNPKSTSFNKPGRRYYYIKSRLPEVL